MNVDKVAAVVYQDGKVLLMFRRNHGKEYYTFPGGGIQEGETKEAALIRELQEETAIHVVPSDPLCTVIWDEASRQYFFKAKYVSGTPALGDFNEKEVMRTDPDQYYEPMWIGIDDMERAVVYPLEVRDIVLASLRGESPTEPVTLNIRLSEARQEV